MKNKKITKLTALFSLILLALTLNACTFFPLPDEKRYARINDIIEQIDYKKVGTPLLEGYDNGDGVFSPSFWFVEIEGETQDFDFLKKEIGNIEGIDCRNSESTTYRTCRMGVVDIELRKNSPEASSFGVQTVSITITDVYSGRDGE